MPLTPEQWQQEKRETGKASGSVHSQLSNRWRWEHPGYTFHRFDPKAAKARADERERTATYARKGPA